MHEYTNMTFHIWTKGNKYSKKHERITNEAINCKDIIINCKHEIDNCKYKILDHRDKSKMNIMIS